MLKKIRDFWKIKFDKRNSFESKYRIFGRKSENEILKWVENQKVDVDHYDHDISNNNEIDKYKKVSYLNTNSKRIFFWKELKLDKKPYENY